MPPSLWQQSCTRADNRMKPQGSALRILLEEFDRIAHGQNGLSRIVGDFATELFLEGHDELDGVETVGAEIVDEACILSHLVGFNAQVLDDDLFHPLANITHRSPSYPCIWLDQSTPPSHCVEHVVATGGITCGRERSRAVALAPMISPRLVPAKPRFGYHTAKALTSTRGYPLATRGTGSGTRESRLEHRHSSVDMQRLAGDIRSLVRGEVDRGRSHLG